MKMQEDDEGRREMSQALLQVMWGVTPVEEIESQLRAARLYLRRVTLPTGAVRFIIFERRNNKVWDSFTFYGEEATERLDDRGA